jgi:predicted DNA-binding transcriptional regulator AlpA
MKSANEATTALMLSVRDVARLMQCSDRHVTNLRNEGRIPPPVKLGVLVRWPRRVIEDWVIAGCPPP